MMANLFAFPQAVIGMMGRKMPPPRVMADAEDERMFAANPNGDQLNQLLGSLLLGQQQPAQAQAAPVAPQPTAPAIPERRRVSPWRVLDRVLGGETITGGLDAERAREQQVAMQPMLMARQAENERIAAALGPQALLAYRANPEAFGESVGYQYRPSTVAEGSALAIPGMGINQVNERRAVVGDRVVGLGSGTQAPRELLQVQPSFAEQTARQKAESDAAIAAGQLDVNRQTANRPQAVTTATGAVTNLINPDGTVGGTIQGRAPTTAPSPVNVELQGRIDATERETLPTVNQMKTLLQSGDVITGFGANARLDAARALAALGNEQARRQVAATQQYQNLSGGLRVALAKSLGTNPSNADILLLEKITAGDIGQSPEALLATVGQAEQRATGLVSDLQRQLGAGAQSGGTVSGPVAVNPTTGERIQWNGSAWVPVG